MKQASYQSNMINKEISIINQLSNNIHNQRNFIIAKLRKKKVKNLHQMSFHDQVHLYADLYGKDIRKHYKNGTLNKKRLRRFVRIHLRREGKEIFKSNIKQSFDKEAYEKYLKSRSWKLIRQDIIAERNGKCEECGSSYRLQVHHKTYKNLFNEQPEDLELLCSKCHTSRHY